MAEEEKHGWYRDETRPHQGLRADHGDGEDEAEGQEPGQDL
jgi:hypothetical protein